LHQAEAGVAKAALSDSAATAPIAMFLTELFILFPLRKCCAGTRKPFEAQVAPHPLNGV
jgi:hypothetical protein